MCLCVNQPFELIIAPALDNGNRNSLKLIFLFCTGATAQGNFIALKITENVLQEVWNTFVMLLVL
jgi:hypothetical protein